MVSFQVSYENEIKELKCDMTETITFVKERIKQEFDIDSNMYIDINITLERPIRSLGKFNVDRGIMPRTMDRYELNRFELEGRTIPVSVILVMMKEVKPIVHRKKSQMNYTINKSSFDTGKKIQTIETPTFDIGSLDDFPSL